MTVGASQATADALPGPCFADIRRARRPRVTAVGLAMRLNGRPGAPGLPGGWEGMRARPSEGRRVARPDREGSEKSLPFKRQSRQLRTVLCHLAEAVSFYL